MRPICEAIIFWSVDAGSVSIQVSSGFTFWSERIAETTEVVCHWNHPRFSGCLSTVSVISFGMFDIALGSLGVPGTLNKASTIGALGPISDNA